MEEKLNQSGTTENPVENHFQELEPRHYGCIQFIGDCEYEEDMGLVIADLIFYNGEEIRVSFTEHNIKELSLFLQKSQIENRYNKHILKK